MADVVSTDPRTGQAAESIAPETTTGEVDRLCTAARAAAPALDDLGRTGRAAPLRRSTFPPSSPTTTAPSPAASTGCSEPLQTRTGI